MAEYGLSSGPFRVGAARSAREIRYEELRSGGLEAGISGSGGWGVYPALYAPFSPPARRWGSYRALGPLSPRSGAGGGAARFFFDPVCEDEPRHFLDSCSLCKKPLGNRDIFMYRGDMPFCSEECRQEQIDMDEPREKNWSLSMKASASRTEQQKQKGKASQDIRVRTAGTVVAG